MRAPTLGDQELALLTYLAAMGPLPAARVAEGFGGPRGLARSTVLTMLERLRRKGRLRRRKAGGVYHYVSTAGRAELLRAVVRDFVATALGGSVEPVVAYLAESSALSASEVRELEELVAKLQARRADGEDEC
jgi:predicted transcriptional regulator